MPSGGVRLFVPLRPVLSEVAKVARRINYDNLVASLDASLKNPAPPSKKTKEANIRKLGPSQSPHAFFKKCQPQQNQRATKKLAQEIYKLCMHNEALARLQPSMAQCYEVAKKNPSKSAYFLANGLQTQSRREKQSLTNQLPSTPPLNCKPE